MKKIIKILKDMGHNFSFSWMENMIFPIMVEFAEKNCPSFRTENNDNENHNIICFSLFLKNYLNLRSL